MRYNLTPFDVIFDHTIPSYMEWRGKIREYFANEHYDPVLLDSYYSILISDIRTIYTFVRQGNIVEEYAGLFSFANPAMRGKHSFNMANFIRRNNFYFNNKRIRTVTGDYGILNIQIKLCGLDLQGATVFPRNQAGAILACIGNNCPPYSFEDTPNCDIICACSVFENENQAYQIWQILEDNKRKGAEVFFTTNTFLELQKFVTYDRLQQMENPADIYDLESYGNSDNGLSNKIYKLV